MNSKKMLVVAVNMSTCGPMIVNKVNVFDFGMVVVKAMAIDLKRNNNVKKLVLVPKALVTIQSQFPEESIEFFSFL